MIPKEWLETALIARPHPRRVTQMKTYNLMSSFGHCVSYRTSKPNMASTESRRENENFVAETPNT